MWTPESLTHFVQNNLVIPWDQVLIIRVFFSFILTCTFVWNIKFSYDSNLFMLSSINECWIFSQIENIFPALMLTVSKSIRCSFTPGHSLPLLVLIYLLEIKINEFCLYQKTSSWKTLSYLINEYPEKEHEIFPAFFLKHILAVFILSWFFL